MIKWLCSCFKKKKINKSTDSFSSVLSDASTIKA